MKMRETRTRIRHDLIILHRFELSPNAQKEAYSIDKRNACVLSHLLGDKNTGYRHGGVDTPQSKQITQNASQQLTTTPIQ
jgi:hypothetical protein